MATIVNTPAHEHYMEEQSGNGISGLLGGLLLVFLIIILLYFGVPILRGIATPNQINVPGKIDVNVNNPQQGGTMPQPQK